MRRAWKTKPCITFAVGQASIIRTRLTTDIKKQKGHKESLADLDLSEQPMYCRVHNFRVQGIQLENSQGVFQAADMRPLVNRQSHGVLREEIQFNSFIDLLPLVITVHLRNALFKTARTSSTYTTASKLALKN